MPACHLDRILPRHAPLHHLRQLVAGLLLVPKAVLDEGAVSCGCGEQLSRTGLPNALQSSAHLRVYDDGSILRLRLCAADVHGLRAGCNCSVTAFSDSCCRKSRSSRGITNHGHRVKVRDARGFTARIHFSEEGAPSGFPVCSKHDVRTQRREPRVRRVHHRRGVCQCPG